MNRVRRKFLLTWEARTLQRDPLRAAPQLGWSAMVPEHTLHIRQGVEMRRTSDIFVRASQDGDNVVNVRVGGYAVQTMEGEIIL
jgi:predicted PhzF superfamily epimerase YddE/YHI9